MEHISMSTFAERFAQMSLEKQRFALRTLAFHLAQAGQTKCLIHLLSDLDFITFKILVLKTQTLIDDYEQIPPKYSTYMHIQRFMIQNRHLLDACDRHTDLVATINSRIDGLIGLNRFYSQLRQALREPYLKPLHPLPDLPRPGLLHTLTGHIDGLIGLNRFYSQLRQALREPYLKPLHPLPDLPRPGLLHTLTGHSDAVSTCTISPDSRIIISASLDETLCVWDMRTGILQARFSGHNIIRGTPISTDGKFFTYPSDDRLQIWDVRTGEVVYTFLGHVGSICDCAISENGRMIISASRKGIVQVWDVNTRSLQVTLDGPEGDDMHCAISANGQTVAAANGNCVYVWNTQTSTLCAAFSDLDDYAHDCGISADGKRVMAATPDGHVWIWNVLTKSCITSFRARHDNRIYNCAMSADGQIVISASVDQTIKLWEARTGRLIRTIDNRGKVYRGAINGNGSLIVVASEDKTLKVWEPNNAISSSRTDHMGWSSSCAISADGRITVAAVRQRSLLLWQKGKREILPDKLKAIRGCAVSSNGRFIISASYGNLLLTIRETTRLQSVRHIKLGTAIPIGVGTSQIINRVHGCAISDDGTTLVAAMVLKPEVIVANVIDGQIRHTLKGHKDFVYGCAMTPDGRTIISSSADTTLKVWDGRTGRLIRTLKDHMGPVNSCALSSDGHVIISASDDCTLKIWNSRTGRLLRTLIGHHQAVTGCAITGNVRFVISVSLDRSIKIWDTSNGVCLTTLMVDGDLQGCACSTDGKFIVAVGLGGVYLLNLVSEDTLAESSSRSWWQFRRKS
jgi:WD40 repeat protein